MPAAHECAHKTLVFVITCTQFLCKHKFDIFLVWGANMRGSCKSMASSCLESPLEENTVIRSPLNTKKRAYALFFAKLYITYNVATTSQVSLPRDRRSLAAQKH